MFLEFHVALDVLKDKLVLHARIEHNETIGSWREVSTALDILVLTED